MATFILFHCAWALAAGGCRFRDVSFRLLRSLTYHRAVSFWHLRSHVFTSISISALYALVMDLGVVVLNGTTSTTHMQDDLGDLQKVRQWIGAHSLEWARVRDTFKSLIEPTT